MRVSLKGSFFFGVWAVLAVVAGSVLMSFHQPFQGPRKDLLALIGGQDAVQPQWRAIHVLSGSCGCSQRVMHHLLQRKPMPQIREEVLLIDGPEPYLPGSAALAQQLGEDGFNVRHLPQEELLQDSKDSGSNSLRGVPLLVFANPDNKIVYLGGYGSSSDQDTGILDQIRLNRVPKPLPILGCAIGARLRKEVDPFHFKY